MSDIRWYFFENAYSGNITVRLSALGSRQGYVSRRSTAKLNIHWSIFVVLINNQIHRHCCLPKANENRIGDVLAGLVRCQVTQKEERNDGYE